MGNQAPSITKTAMTTTMAEVARLSSNSDISHSRAHNNTHIDGRYTGHDRRRRRCSISNKSNVQSESIDPQKQEQQEQQEQQRQLRQRQQLSKMERLWMDVAASAATDGTNSRTVTPPSSSMIDVYQTFSTVMVPSSSSSQSLRSLRSLSSSSSWNGKASTTPTKSVKKTKTAKSLSPLSSLSSSNKTKTAEDEDGDIVLQQQQQQEKETACQMWKDMILRSDVVDELVGDLNEDDRHGSVRDVGGVTKNKKKKIRRNNRRSLENTSSRRTNGIPFRKCYDPSCECNCNNSSSTTTTKAKPVTTTEPSTPSTVALSVESVTTTTTTSPSWTSLQRQTQKRDWQKEGQKQQSISKQLLPLSTITGEVPYCLQTIQQSRQIHDSKDDNSYEDSRRYDTIDRCVDCSMSDGRGEDDLLLVGLEVRQQHPSTTTRNRPSLDDVNDTPSSNNDVVVRRDEKTKKKNNRNKKKEYTRSTTWSLTSSRVRSVDYYMPQRRRRSEDIVDMTYNDPFAVRSSDSITHEKPLYSSSSSQQMFRDGNDTKTKQHGPLRPRSGSTTSGYGTRPSPTSVIQVKKIDKGLPSIPLHSNQPIPIHKDCHVRNRKSSNQSTRSSTYRQDSVDMIEGRLDECRQNVWELKRKRNLYAHDPITRQHLSVEMARIYNRMAMLHVQAGRYSTALYAFEHSIDTLTSNIVVRSADGGTPYSHRIMIRTLEESTGFMTDSAFFTAIDAFLGQAKVYASQRCWQQCKSLSKKVVTLLHTEGRSRMERTPREIYRRVFNNDEDWSVLFGRAQVLLGQVYHHYHHRVDLALRYYNDVLSWYHSTITTATAITTRQRCLVADTIYHLGNLHSSQGMILFATVCYRDAATMYMGLLSGRDTHLSQRTWFPTIMADAASALGCHGWTLFWEGRYEESWYTTRHALDWTIQSLGQHHRNVSTLQSQLGWISYILVCFTDPRQPRGRSTAGRRRIPATQFCNNTANAAAAATLQSTMV